LNVAVSTADHIQQVNPSITVFIWALLTKFSNCGRRRQPLICEGLILLNCLPTVHLMC